MPPVELADGRSEDPVQLRQVVRDEPAASAWPSRRRWMTDVSPALNGPAPLDVGRVDHLPVPLDVAVAAADDEEHELVVARVPELPRHAGLDVDEPARPELELLAVDVEARPGRCGRSRARPGARA